MTDADDRRVQFDFEIDFANGGGIQGQGFRLDIDARTSTTTRSPPTSCATCGC